MMDKGKSAKKEKGLQGGVTGLIAVLQPFKFPFGHSFNLAVTSDEAVAFSFPAV